MTLIALRRTSPTCGYEQWCSCATWVPGEGWVRDMEIERRRRKAERRAMTRLDAESAALSRAYDERTRGMEQVTEEMRTVVR